MAWRTPQGDWLIEGRSHPIQLGLAVSRVHLPDGRLVRASSEFLRCDDDGALLQHYRGPVTSTVDDDLYVFDIHVVIDGRLLRCTWIENYRDGDELRSVVRLEGLQEVADDALPFAAGSVIARHAQRTS